ncbi:MAG: SUMF1/EgtB/PvdO family nonheme iron enzyme, partial [Planctomycetaceae bacterium]
MAKQSNYELFEELGRGENSVVHRAYDLVLGRDVAIKKLTADSGSAPGQSNDQRAKRFLKEAGFLAQFEHENVLRIHAVDQDNGWIIMELMKGTLSSQIAAEPMPADMVRSVLRQMLSALDFLHQKDKVHGAVRPSNILINDQGTVKLSDFEASTRDGELRAPTGSKKYLAPELIKSDFGAFGPAVDLYCLGFTVLELLTGKKFNSLFPGTGEGAIDADVAWLRWHSSDDPMQPVKKIDSSIPDDLATVIDQLLKKPVAERPQSAAEVVKLLDKKPLVPVQVPDAAAPKITQEDVQKILPTKAVKLREGKTRKTKALKPSAKPQSSKDRLNEMLGKPYVLWPICIGILLAALMVGNHLRGDKVLESAPIADKGGETTPIEEPQSQLLDVQFRVIPDANEATFSLDGQQKDLASLKLEPGRYEVTVEKEGFEPFQSAFEIDKDNTTFDIALRELVPVEPVAGKTPEPIEPRFVDVRIIVEPENAALRVAGSDIADGVVRLQPDVVEELKLQASAEGYESRTATWSWEEIAAADYELRINLDKMQQPISVPTIALPDSLIPKPGSAQDQATQLPSRAYVKALQDVAPYEMTLVQAGSYTFGVPSGQLRTWELPAQEVEVLAPFYIGVDEVTHSQFAAFAEATQNAGKIDLSKSDEPVTGVSIKQAAVFCKWVGGRLPQEEEWEAAVRGSDDKGFPLPWGEANLSPEKCRLFRGESDSENGPASTGQLGAGSNQIGMVNTIGNVSEWCDTQHSPTEFIVKGCSFRMPPGDHVRVTWRNAAKWQGANDIGLRLVVPLDEEPEESLALAFVPPTNINEVLQSQPSQSNDEDESTKPRELVYTKTVQELAAEFTGPAELVIDGAGFMSEIADIQFSPDGKQIAVG